MSDHVPETDWDRVYWTNYRSSLLSRSAWARHVRSLLDAADLIEVRVKEVWKHNIEWAKACQEAGTRNAYPQMQPVPSEIFAVYFMLVGFALENLLKGALVQPKHWKIRDQFEKGGKLPSALKNHDICKLCSDLGIKLSLEEEDIARRLSRAATWAGRYPIPVDYKATATAEKFSDGQEWSVGHFHEDDPDRVARFVARLRAETGM